MSETDEAKGPSLWLPEPNTVLHQAIGKMGEESGELCAIVCRTLIQGVSEKNPDTDKANMEALWREMADVEALITVVKAQLAHEGKPLDIPRYYDRVHSKVKHKNKWFDMIREYLLSVRAARFEQT